MKNRILAVCFLFFSTFIGCKSQVAESFPADTEDRRQIMNEWIGSAESIVAATHDAEAADILAMIKKSSFLAAPSKKGAKDMSIQALDDIPVVPYRVAIMPLLKRDRELDAEWNAEYEEGSYASYTPYSEDVGLITLKEKVDYSKMRMGIILLHEGKHMFIHREGELRDIAQKNDQIAAAIDEYRTFEFDSRLVLLLGGDQYRMILRKSIASLEKKIKRKETVIFTRPWFSRELQDIFGKANNDTELIILEQELWTAGLMRAFDNVFGYNSQEASALKLRFFRQFYGYKIPA